MRRIIFIISGLTLASLLHGQRVDSLTVEYAPAGGFYGQQQSVELFAPGADAIYYTLDGTTPTAESRRYHHAIMLDETVVLRAVAYRDGQPGRRMGQTYFIAEPRTRLPVVSIAIAPSVLFDPTKGIFVQGQSAVDSLWYLPGANFWTRREFGAQVEIFESDGRSVYNSYSGLRLFGGMSRLFPQKSIALVARHRYGETRFRYPIFGPDRPDRFKYLVLRNSGSDFGKTHFRDALMTGLVADWDLETQAYRPAHVYINGAYWGIYNLREKVNRYFIDSYADEVDKDSIDLLEHYLVRKRGSRGHYQEMLDFLERYDLSVAENYAYLGEQMEIDNFMLYEIAQIYFDNQDAGGNIKYWRPQTPDGRWRWILYDTDWGFGLHDPLAYRNNSLAFHTEPNGPNWPNPPWSTFLLRKLLQNEDFRRLFVNRFADHLNTTFAPARVERFIDSLYLQLLPEMPRHLARWRLNEDRWKAEV
ncbi:MAG: CotH kinase family protein, partial [Lewinella sp.]|nr:CotH kinase family protein [Lewinella sp.]